MTDHLTRALDDDAEITNRLVREGHRVSLTGSSGTRLLTASTSHPTVFADDAEPVYEDDEILAADSAAADGRHEAVAHWLR